MSTLSAVIVTIGRVDGLSRCLQALARQTRHPDEVVVIANGLQATSIRKVIREFSLRLWIKYVEVREQCIPKARNIGIQESGSDLIAFVDDDCEPFDDWCESILSAAEGYEDLIFQGEIKEETNGKLFSVYAGAARRVYVETYSSCEGGRGEMRRELDTANVTFRSHIFRDSGNWFDERLARCSDAHLGARLFHKGYSIRYCPSIRVRHFSNHNLTSFLKKAFNTGGSRFLMRGTGCETGGRADFWQSLAFTVHLWKGQRPVIGLSIMLLNLLFNAVGASGFLYTMVRAKISSSKSIIH